MHDTVRFALAGPDEEALLRQIMPEFYAQEGLPYDEAIALRSLRQLWRDPSLGRVLIAHSADTPVGYAVITFGFSLEFHGRDALVDELFVRESHRGRGIGAAFLTRAEQLCVDEGIRALHLEVDHSNTRALKLYQRSGYQDHDRHLLTKWLTPRAPEA